VLGDAQELQSSVLNTTFFVARSLLAGQQYSITVSAVAAAALNSRGLACNERTSDPITVRLPETAPTSAPTSVSYLAVNHTHVELTWVEPSVSQRGGVLGPYVVVYQRVVNQARANPALSDGVQSTMTLSNSTMFLLALPQTDIGYSVQVCATTAVGQGPCSTAVVTRTTEGGLLVIWPMIDAHS
jgi:hypothetical protein